MKKKDRADKTRNKDLKGANCAKFQVLCKLHHSNSHLEIGVALCHTCGELQPYNKRCKISFTHKALKMGQKMDL